MPGLPAQPIIIIKKKGGHGGGHHGGAWKVAYADFVTAMMALFIVLWLLSASEQVQKAVGGYFTDPQGKGKDVGNGLKGAGSESLTLKKDDMNKLKDKLEQAVRDATALTKIREHVIFTVTGEGLRVELLEGEGSTFFESGSAMPTSFGKELLQTLAEEIGKLPNKVTMEGHTDSKPFTQRSDYSNWELSSDRANAARRWMMANGMREDQVSQVRGFADQSLRNPDDPNDASNRRVTLIIQYQSSKPAADAEGKVGAEAADSKDAKPGAGGSARSDGKPGDGKPGEAKPGEAKPGEAKPGEAKPGEAKPAAAKSAEARPAAAKSAEARPAEPAKPSPAAPTTARK